MAKVKTGLEALIDSPPDWMRNKRLGLLSNPAGVDRRLRHGRELIAARFPKQLKALYSPQHGFFAEKQDNMIESEHMVDPVLQIPVFSLYGHTRVPTEEMFDPIDILLADLQDVGTRVYTFIYTLSYCMEAAKIFGKRVVVLDRPNPLGGIRVEGNPLAPEYASFVGRYPMPMRHGLTIGELARLFNRHFGIECDLAVIPMVGWKRPMTFFETGLPWVPPSPNLPTPASAMVYPGQVIWEGTNISEGRGTTQPFEMFGAPFADTDLLLSAIGGRDQPGIVLRPVAFEPTANKWRGVLCRGFQIHLTDFSKYRPYTTSLKLLQGMLRHHRDAFQWKPPPYEYEFKKLPIDLILGDRGVRKAIESIADIDEMASDWKSDIERFIQVGRRFHLYP
ncbi:MAG: exo-beta-N-acetylmuramidase NamZ domain-containing protein [Thermodesulfobacteriota bacterium]